MNTRLGILLAFFALGSSTLLGQAPALVQPDAPSSSAREAELAKRAAAIVDAFTDGNAFFTRDGQRIVFTSNRDGLPQLYVADAAKPDGPASRIVTSKERTTGAFPLADGKTLLFRSDHGADENWSLFLAGLDGGAPTELTPGARLMRDGPVVPDGMPQTAFYSARVMSEPGSAAYSLELTAGSKEKKLYEDKVPGFLTDVSRDGKWGLWLQTRSIGDTTLVLLDLAKGSGASIYPPEGGNKVDIWNARFSVDGTQIFMGTDGGGEQMLLLALDPAGKEISRYAESRPAEMGDLLVDKMGTYVAFSLGAGNHTDVRLLGAKTLQPKVSIALPLGSGFLGDFSRDGRRLTVTWSTPDAPGEVYAIDVQTGKVSALRQEPRPSLSGLPKIRASIVDVPAFDGLKLPTNLYLPADFEGKKLPVLVVYHGGPAGSSEIRWSATVRFFTGLGYAVVEPNVRGSGGFGRTFEQADNGPKRVNAFRDVETTSRWAAAQPWADKNRMVVFGGSYGGYTVLIALERWPDIWSAGIDLFGVANMTTFLRSTSGLIREIFKVEFGDVDQDAPFLKTISPIEEIGKIVDPVFVYAGANDPRVPRPESDQVVRALRERRVSVEYMVADNEGHSLARRENQIAFYSRAGRFLEAQLPGK